MQGCVVFIGTQCRAHSVLNPLHQPGMRRYSSVISSNKQLNHPHTRPSPPSSPPLLGHQHTPIRIILYAVHTTTCCIQLRLTVVSPMTSPRDLVREIRTQNSKELPNHLHHRCKSRARAKRRVPMTTAWASSTCVRRMVWRVRMHAEHPITAAILRLRPCFCSSPGGGRLRRPRSPRTCSSLGCARRWRLPRSPCMRSCVGCARRWRCLRSPCISSSLENSVP